MNARPAPKTSPLESQVFVSGFCGNVLTILFCKSQGSRSNVAEESGLLGHDLVSLGKWFPTILCNKAPSYSRFKHQDKYIFLGQLDSLHLEYQEPLIQQHSITSQNTLNIHPPSLSHMLLTDEAYLACDGTTNFHYQYLWTATTECSACMWFMLIGVGTQNMCMRHNCKTPGIL